MKTASSPKTTANAIMTMVDLRTTPFPNSEYGLTLLFVQYGI
jgi:hypothetical protein